MKKIVSILSIVFITIQGFSQTVTFPSTATNFFGFVSMNDYIQVDTFPIAQMDTIRYLRYNGVNYINKNWKSTTWDAVTLRIFADNTDQTARLNWILSKTSVVKHIIVRQQYTGNLRIDGNVTVPIGTIIELDGVGITGLGNINGNGQLFISSPDFQVFDTTLRYSKIKTPFGYYPARWSGVVSDGSTVNDKALAKADTATYKDQPVGLPWGTTIVTKPMYINKSIIGLADNKGSIIKYNNPSTLTNVIVANIASDSVKFKNITLDGNVKARFGLYINDNTSDVEVSYCDFTGFEQQSTETNVTVALFFGLYTDRTWIHHCYFTNINAKNSGASRGIWTSFSDISPKGVIIEYNKFNGVTNTGSGSWDADQIVIQGNATADSAGMIVRYNKHENISKRGEKFQVNGITSYKNTFESSRHLSGLFSYAPISMYGNMQQVFDNEVKSGVYEQGFEIGTATGTVRGVRLINNTMNMSLSSITGKDGCRMYGKKNREILIATNTFRNVQRGIFLDCSSIGTQILYNIIRNTSQNAISTSVTNVNNPYPDNWQTDIKIIGNDGDSINTFQAFDFTRINGGEISFNSVTQVNQSVINRTTLDSLIGQLFIFGNRGPNSINYGSTSTRPTITNPNACRGLTRFNTDSGWNQQWTGGAWIDLKGSVAGGGISALTGAVTGSGSGSVATTLASDIVTNTNLSNMVTKTYKGRTSAGTGDPEDVSVATLKTDLNLVKSDVGLGNVDNTSDATKNSATATLTNKTISGTNNTISGIAESSVTNLITDLAAKVPTSRAITINGVSYDLSSDRSWTVSASTPSGDYIPTQNYSLPSLSSFTADTLGWYLSGSKVHIFGELTVTVGTITSEQVLIINMPSSYSSFFTAAGQAGGGGSANNTSDDSNLAVRVYSAFGSGGLNGIGLKWKAVSNATYKISFVCSYSYLNN